jgi:eukaryotic-like serine/threonine-protein kinase
MGRPNLTTDLAQAKQLDVISTERIRGLIRRRTRGDAHMPMDEARDVAQEVHADWFLSGALLKIGAGLRLDLRVQDTATGQVLFADKVEGENAQAVFAMADKATAEVLGQLVPDAGVAASSAAVLTSNIEALRAYEEGRELSHPATVWPSSFLISPRGRTRSTIRHGSLRACSASECE